MPVYKDEKTNTWYCQFYYKDWDGKRKHTTKRGFSKKSEATKFEAQFKLAKRNRTFTFGMILDAYLENLNQRLKLNTIRPSTINAYENNIKVYIKPYIPLDIALDDITAEFLNDWLIKLTEYKTMHNKKLTANSIITAKTQLGAIFNFAVRKKYLISNPLHEAERLPLPLTKEKTIWSFEQYTMFYNTITKPHHKVIFNILFFCGLRLGEVMALTPSDIGSDGTLYIRKAVIRIKGKTCDTKVKTPSSERKVSVPKVVFDQLVNYVNSLYNCGPNDKIFPFNRDTVYRYLTNHVKALDLPYLSPHGLRHSNASLLLNLTHDVTLVSKRLGHKNPRITLQVYSHMMPGAENAAVKKLDKLITSTQDKNIVTIQAEK